MNIILCSNRIHNNPHHHSCRTHCWFHHDRNHLQLRDEFLQHKSHDDSICMLNNYLFWHSADNNPHYHSYSLRCWLHHYNNRPQQLKDMDNLYWKKTSFIEIYCSLNWEVTLEGDKSFRFAICDMILEYGTQNMVWWFFSRNKLW